MIDEIYKKRRQIRKAYDQVNIPSRELILELLEKTRAVCPSKSNFMPYKIHLLGPDNTDEKNKLFRMTLLSDNCLDNHNVYQAPWCLVFTNRLVPPDQMEDDVTYKRRGIEACNNPERYNSPWNLQKTSLEIGMFSTIFTGLCLENNMGVSFTKAFVSNNIPNQKNMYDEGWEILPFTNDPIMFMMQCGYLDPNINPDPLTWPTPRPPLEDILEEW